MPPVARRYTYYDEGTPQRAFQTAVLARYDTLEEFFKDLAQRLNVQADSASGTYYGFMAGTRSTPERHKAAYVDLTGVDPDLVEQIARARPTTTRAATRPVDETARLRAIVREELAAVLAVLERIEQRTRAAGGEHATDEEQTG